MEDYRSPLRGMSFSKDKCAATQNKQYLTNVKAPLAQQISCIDKMRALLPGLHSAKLNPDIAKSSIEMSYIFIH